MIILVACLSKQKYNLHDEVSRILLHIDSVKILQNTHGKIIKHYMEKLLSIILLWASFCNQQIIIKREY